MPLDELRRPLPTGESRHVRKSVRIGCGAGFAGDRIDPATDLANRGELDFLFFECLAERTLAASQLARRANPAAGYNARLEQRFAAVLPGCRKFGTRIVTNMGAANPKGAGEALSAMSRRSGYAGLTIAVVEGDDVADLLRPDMVIQETGEPLEALRGRLISANAYLGADVIVQALGTEADVIITGRVADPSLVVGPLAHAFGWNLDQWDLLAAGTVAGHLLECSAHVTGGYFADPGYKDVSNLAYVGYPFADIDNDGRAVVSKLDGTGGCVTTHTVKEQLLYEVHDPAAYITPDVIADFSHVSVDSVGVDKVMICGATGQKRPQNLKVTIGLDGGFLAETEISYAGNGASARARLAASIVTERMANLHRCSDSIRIDFIGLNALHSTAVAGPHESSDVRLRAAMRSSDRRMCETLLAEMEAIWIAGPAGGGGVRGSIVPSIFTRSTFIDRDQVNPKVTVISA